MRLKENRRNFRLFYCAGRGGKRGFPRSGPRILAFRIARQNKPADPRRGVGCRRGRRRKYSQSECARTDKLLYGQFSVCACVRVCECCPCVCVSRSALDGGPRVWSVHRRRAALRCSTDRIFSCPPTSSFITPCWIDQVVLAPRAARLGFSGVRALIKPSVCLSVCVSCRGALSASSLAPRGAAHRSAGPKKNRMRPASISSLCAARGKAVMICSRKQAKPLVKVRPSGGRRTRRARACVPRGPVRAVRRGLPRLLWRTANSVAASSGSCVTVMSRLFGLRTESWRRVPASLAAGRAVPMPGSAQVWRRRSAVPPCVGGAKAEARPALSRGPRRAL